MLKTTAGRALAAMPKSTSQTSPRRALSMFLFLLVVGEKGLFGGSNQVAFSYHAVRIITNNTVLALAILLMNRLFHSPEFFGRQRRQRRFDFHNCAHARQPTKQRPASQPGFRQSAPTTPPLHHSVRFHPRFCLPFMCSRMWLPAKPLGRSLGSWRPLRSRAVPPPGSARRMACRTVL